MASFTKIGSSPAGQLRVIAFFGVSVKTRWPHWIEGEVRVVRHQLLTTSD